MPSWSFKLEWEVFDGVKIIAAGHVDMKEIVFDPNRGVCCAIVGFNVHGFKPVWKFVLHYFVSEAERVCGSSMLGLKEICPRGNNEVIIYFLIS